MNTYVIAGRDMIIGKGLSAKHWHGQIIFGRNAIFFLPNQQSAEAMKAKYGKSKRHRHLELGMIVAGVIGVAYSQIGGAGWFWGFTVMVVLTPILSVIFNWVRTTLSPDKTPDTTNAVASGLQEHIVAFQDLPSDIVSHHEWPIKKSTSPVIVINRRDVEKIELRGGRIVVEAYGDIMKLGMKLFGRGVVVDSIRQLDWKL